MRPHTEPCVVPSCGRIREERLWCHGHYEAWRRTGIAPTERFADTTELRFMAKMVELPNGCWLWTGATDGQGRYGRMADADGVSQPATRIAYELFIGPVDHSLDLDHLCRFTRCVNPFHLDPVTHRDNILRGDAPTALNARKTYCKRGHEFTPENTIKMGGRGRCCRECQTLRCRNRWCGLMPESCQCETPRCGPQPRKVAQHGTTSRYGGKHNCRCDDCRAAWSAYMKSRRLRADSLRESEVAA